MATIREILARNLKENRNKLGITQSELAEKANVSVNFLAMIELSRKFPTPDVMERLATALNIETHELFSVPPSPEMTLERLHQAVLSDIERAVQEAIEKTLTAACKAPKR